MDKGPTPHSTSSVRALRQRLEAQQQANRRLTDYVRSKIDQLLEVMGSSPINPDELDDETLLDLDPIGIICSSFSHVLSNLRETNIQLGLARDEIQTIFDTAGAAILVLDTSRRIVAYNRKVEEFFLPEYARVIGRDCQEVICNGDPPRQGCSFEHVLKRQVAEKNLDWSFRGRSFDVVGKPILNRDGNVTHVVLCYTDVSDRKRSMMALRDALTESHEVRTRINGILRSVEDPLIVSEAGGEIQLQNAPAEALLAGCRNLGCAPDDSFAATLRRHLQSGTAQQGFWTADLAVETPQGARVYQARTSSISHQGNKGVGFVTFLHDVTREREIERLKSEFVSTAAHELRTPLSTILGFSELILNEESLSDHDLRDYIGIVHQKAEGLAQIVNDLLDISRIESGEGLQLELSDCSLRQLCDDALLGYRVYADRYTFELVLPDDEVLLTIDRFGMAQVFENILSNAVKYSPPGSIIRCDGGVSGAQCHVRITDQGIGMNREQLERVFDKFYRADASNTAIPGTGLGMTIVKHIIEAHDGEVWVESVPSQGTTVHFTLPCHV